MNIYQLINEVRKDVSYIQKDAKVQGYKAVSHDMVIAALRPALIKHGIAIFPSLLKGETVPTGTATSSGTPIIRYEAEYMVTFVNIRDKEDFVQMSVSSHANDHGDKAPGKAISYAVKTAQLKMFSLETGENDESRIEGSPKDVFSEETLKHFANVMLQSLIDDQGHFVIGRAQINQKDLWEATGSGTRGKGTGYYSSAEKQAFGTKGGEYIAAIDVYAKDIAEAVNADDEHGVRENLEELTDVTDKKLVWARLDDSAHVFIRKLAE